MRRREPERTEKNDPQISQMATDEIVLSLLSVESVESV